MKTYKKGRPSKRKVGKKNGPSKKNKLRKKNKTKKMKKIKGGSLISKKCIPVVMESGNVKRAMQNILCGLEMYMTEDSIKPYGINTEIQVANIQSKPHIEVVTDNNQRKYIKITDMLYRESGAATKVYTDKNTGLEIIWGEDKKPIVESLRENGNLTPDIKLKLINHLNSIPIGLMTSNEPTYTRDDDPKSFHNTPIFYEISRTTQNISENWDMGYLQNSLNEQKNKIYNKHKSTYENAIQRLTTNSVCNEMLRKIIGKTQSIIPDTIRIELQVGNKNKSPETVRGDTSLLGNDTITVKFPIGNFVPERSPDAKN